VIESIGHRAERMAYRNRSEMKYLSLILKIVLFIFLLIEATVFASEQKLPVMKGKKIVALVNDEPITLEEFNQEVSSLKGSKSAEGKKGTESELLRRLINTKLIIQEARKIGLDELPEVKNMVDVFSRITLRELLAERHLKDVKADQKEVEKIYQELAKGWKIKSVIFEKEDAAKKMEEDIKGGKNFDEIARQFVADGTAKGGEEGNYLDRKELLPQVSEAVSKMEVGSVSPIIPVGSGFVILKVEDIRNSESQEAREVAKREALVSKKEGVLKNYNDALIKKYVKLNKKVLDDIDFETKEPGFQKLLEDKRVIAEIQGEKPITVGELTDNLRQQLYHGVERAIESKKLNEGKIPILDEMLYKRVFRKEALRLRIDKTEAYKNRVKEYENSVIFGAFIQKVVVPDIKIKEEELKTYYNDHIKDYTFPEMIKINSLVFSKRGNAEAAIEKLREGTDFQWLAENAEGQIDKSKSKDVLSLEGKFLTTNDLPEGLRKSFSGAKPGDFRLYESPEGYFYALAIQDVIPAKPQPFEEAKKKIAKIVFDDKLKKLVEEWAEKLRAVSDVKVYLTN
jgi:parvulin-like peptidyl-prolyl isomerase